MLNTIAFEYPFHSEVLTTKSTIAPFICFFAVLTSLWSPDRQIKSQTGGQGSF